ncbi:MAG: hypothetical protein WC530_10825 [Candidatus Omnitrophota bacterium]|jgi:hypothetical protein
MTPDEQRHIEGQLGAEASKTRADDNQEASMKCHYCGRAARKVNVVETRSGSGTTKRSVPVCKLHSSLFAVNHERPYEAGLKPIGDGGYQAVKTQSGGGIR